jgi:hypothetical protein
MRDEICLFVLIVTPRPNGINGTSVTSASIWETLHMIICRHARKETLPEAFDPRRREQRSGPLV